MWSASRTRQGAVNISPPIGTVLNLDPPHSNCIPMSHWVTFSIFSEVGIFVFL